MGGWGPGFGLQAAARSLVGTRPVWHCDYGPTMILDEVETTLQEEQDPAAVRHDVDGSFDSLRRDGNE